MTPRFFIPLLILLLLIPGRTGAEKKPFKSDLRIGPAAGINLSKVSFHPAIKEQYALKYNAGIAVRWTTERYFGIQGEIKYSARGWEREFVDKAFIEQGFEYSRDINYIEAPLMTHIYFGGDVVRGFFNLGPQIGFYLNDKEIYNFENYLNGLSKEERLKNFPEAGRPIQKKFDWGICGGGGFEVRTKTGSYIIEARYYFGLGNIFNSKKGIDDDGLKINPLDRSAHSNISVNFVYLIPISIK